MSRIYNIYHPSDLRNSRDSADLLQATEANQQFWSCPFEEKSENFRFVVGEQISPEEADRYRKKYKVPVVFNPLTTSRRTIYGHMIQTRSQADFIPRGAEDSAQADVLSTLAHHEAYNQGDKFLDPEVVDEVWMGGWSNVLNDMVILPGRKPRMRQEKLGSFSVMWDPASREVITRRDARFVDVVHGKSIEELKELYPEKKRIIQRAVTEGLEQSASYEGSAHSEYDKNRFLSTDYFNGLVKVVERYYKVVRHEHFYYDPMRKKEILVKDIQKFKHKAKGVTLARRSREYLYLAVICPAITRTQRSNKASAEYLFNGEYHCRPHTCANPDQIIWPIVEMIAEHVNGRIMSFVKPQKDAIRTFNALITNILEAAKHSAAAAYLVDEEAFVSPAEATKASKYRGDSNQTFKVKTGRAKDAMSPIMAGGTNQDTSNGIALAKEYLLEVSSTPPATQGWGEGTGVSGKLNQQRIEQAFLQLQPLMLKFSQFKKQRLELRYYYWRTYYRDERIIRLVDPHTGLPTGDPVTLNAVQTEMDPETGEIDVSFMRDPAVGDFDVAISEAPQSPVRRYQTQEQIMQFLRESGIGNIDPEIAKVLTLYWLDLSDADAKLKLKVEETQKAQEQAQQNDPTAQIEQAKIQADMEKTQAEIQKIQAETATEVQETENLKLKNDQDEMNLAQQEAEQTYLSRAESNPLGPTQPGMSTDVGINPVGTPL